MPFIISGFVKILDKILWFILYKIESFVAVTEADLLSESISEYSPKKSAYFNFANI